MGKLLKIKAGKSTILIESSDISEKGGYLKKAGGFETINKNLDKLLGIVDPISRSFLKAFNAMEKRPDSASVEFGLSLSWEGSMIVVKGSAEAALRVTLNWDLE